MAKFCKKCGTKLDESTGLCPKCDAAKLKKQQRQKESNKKEKRAEMTKEKKIKNPFVNVILFGILLLVIAAGVSAALAYFDIYDVPFISDIIHTYVRKSDGDDLLANDVNELKEVNLGEETRAKCQILDIIEATESKQTMSEEDAALMFDDRGFDSAEVTTMYSMDGTYYGNQAINYSSEIHHPLYSVFYVSPDNFLWMVYCCNGEFSAYPISYVLSDTATCEVLVSENEYVMSYDSDTNCFYKIIPNDGECIIKQVSRIDSDMLDTLAARGLGIR